MNPLFRLPLMAAIGCGFAASAHAQSSVKLYGLFDLNVGSFQLAGTKKLNEVSNGDFSTSFFGLTGKEDLGGGLSADFTLESFFRPDTGRAARVSFDNPPNVDVFWARSAFVGLSSSSLGALKLGRTTTTMFVSTLLFNPFGDSFGFSPSIRHYYTNAIARSFTDQGSALIGDSGWSNSVLYSSPKFGGLSFALQGNLGEGSATSAGKNFGGNLLYFGGPFAATVAYQKVKNSSDLRFGDPLPAGFSDQTTYQIGASYDLSVVKLYGQYGHIKTEAAVETTAKIGQVGVGVPIGAGSALASYGYDKVKGGGLADAISKIITLGYDYNLSKRTELYAIYMNDKKTALSTGNAFAAGIRHTF